MFHYLKDSDWESVTLDSEESGGRPLVRQFEFPVQHNDVRGRRIVFFSDLHWDRRGDVRAAERLVKLINGLRADWVIFGGDLVCRPEFLSGALEILGQLCPNEAKLAVLGNRERLLYRTPGDFWYRKYADAGFRLLVNDVWIPESGGGVFGGLDDVRYGSAKIDIVKQFAEDGRFVVLLSHSPDSVGHTTGRFIGHLILAGHTHGGQFRLPLIGPVYTGSEYGRQFDMGWRRRESDGAMLYVSAGAGETGGMIFRRRIMCPAEIAVIDFV